MSNEAEFNLVHVRARDLRRGDAFFLQVYGEVTEIEPIAGGKRIRVKLALENQGSVSATLRDARG
jgi:hypothetical protein